MRHKKHFADPQRFSASGQMEYVLIVSAIPFMGSASLRHRSFVPGGGNKRSVAGHEAGYQTTLSQPPSGRRRKALSPTPVLFRCQAPLRMLSIRIICFFWASLVPPR